MLHWQYILVTQPNKLEQVMAMIQILLQSLQHLRRFKKPKYHKHTNETITCLVDVHIYGSFLTDLLVDLWLFGLSCCYNDCTWAGHSKTYLTAWQRGPITFPQRECVSHMEKEQSGGTDSKVKIENERHTACACMLQKRDRLISHQWPFKVFSVGTSDLFVWCQ